MTLTREFIQPLPAERHHEHIVRLHTSTERKAPIPDNFWQSLKQVKSKALLLEEEAAHLYTLMRWSGQPCAFGSWCRLEEMACQAFSDLSKKISRLEKETIADLFYDEVELNKLLHDLHKLEKEYAELERTFTPIKMQALRHLASTTAITFV